MATPAARRSTSFLRLEGQLRANVGKAIEAMLKELAGKKPAELVKDRRQKFLDMGSKSLAA